MALRRITFSVTPETEQGGGKLFGSDDVRLPTPAGARPSRLIGVQVDATEAVGSPHVTIRELDTDFDADEDSSDTVPGRAIYSKQNVAGPPFVDDDVTGSDETGDVVWIQSRDLRCEIDGAIADDVYTVYMYYESAGDWRF